MKRRSNHARYKTPVEMQVGNANPNPDVHRSILHRVGQKPVTFNFLKAALEDHQSEKHQEAAQKLKEIANTKDT